jgi:hypothetical protein
MNFKDIAIGGLAVLALLFGYLYFSHPPSFGGASGPAHYQYESFLQGLGIGGRDQFTVTNLGALTDSALAEFDGGLIQGGGTFATTSTGSVTLSASSIASASVIEHTNAGATTFTLPASTTMSTFLPSSGDTRTVYFLNLGTAKDTIAAGTGIILTVASSTENYGVSPSGSAVLHFIRKANTDVVVEMVPGI